MSTSTMTPEVFTLVDRMAAAFMRNDIRYARELADEFRQTCESDGRRAEHAALVRRSREEMEMYREGDAWFVTKDGLKTKDKIKPADSYHPREWQRACRKGVDNWLPVDAPVSYKPIEIRTYRLEEWGQDGLPIYREQ